MSHPLSALLQLYIVVIFVRVILSWFPISPDSPMAGVYRLVYSLTEPVLGPIRRVMPSVGFGGMGLDLSPLIVLFALELLIIPIVRSAGL
ncbi:MAG: YggT family protein [Acidimicrobiia bacterium]|nr:YggT family protein [Acidimicrobiia bacterium]MBV9285809.1 YggT family protein [Acidimicrobiia bacterium]